MTGNLPGRSGPCRPCAHVRPPPWPYRAVRCRARQASGSSTLGHLRVLSPRKRACRGLAGVALRTAALLLAAGGDGDGGGSDDPTDGATETATGGAGEEAQTYSIGITQIVSHPSLDAARDGFKAALADAGL